MPSHPSISSDERQFWLLVRQLEDACGPLPLPALRACVLLGRLQGQPVDASAAASVVQPVAEPIPAPVAAIVEPMATEKERIACYVYDSVKRLDCDIPTAVRILGMSAATVHRRLQTAYSFGRPRLKCRNWPVTHVR